MGRTAPVWAGLDFLQVDSCHLRDCGNAGGSGGGSGGEEGQCVCLQPGILAKFFRSEIGFKWYQLQSYMETSD